MTIICSLPLRNASCTTTKYMLLAGAHDKLHISNVRNQGNNEAMSKFGNRKSPLCFTTTVHWSLPFSPKITPIHLEMKNAKGTKSQVAI